MATTTTSKSNVNSTSNVAARVAAAKVPAPAAAAAAANTTLPAPTAAGAPQRASRTACSAAAAAMYASAMEHNVLPAQQALACGPVYVPKGGKPSGQRTQLCLHVQRTINAAGGQLAWGILAASTFTFTNNAGVSVTQQVKGHLTFLLGNGVMVVL